MGTSTGLGRPCLPLTVDIHSCGRSLLLVLSIGRFRDPLCRYSIACDVVDEPVWPRDMYMVNTDVGQPGWDNHDGVLVTPSAEGNM
jgi:hypothetical protein